MSKEKQENPVNVLENTEIKGLIDQLQAATHPLTPEEMDKICDYLTPYLNKESSHSLLTRAVVLGLLALFPSPFGGIITSHTRFLHNSPEFLGLASAPTAANAFRWLATHMNDRGLGKQAIQGFMLTSLIGTLGMTCFLQYQDISKIEKWSASYWMCLSLSALTAACTAVFPVSLMLAKKSGGSRHGSRYGMYASGITNMAPVISLFLIAMMGTTLTEGLSSHEIRIKMQILYLLEAFLIAIGLIIAQPMPSPLVKQIQALQIPDEAANELSKWLGETTHQTAFFKKLSKVDKAALGEAFYLYAASFGTLMMLTSSGPSIFTHLGFAPRTAVLSTASIVAVSQSVRALLPFLPMPMSPEAMTRLSFLCMALCSYIIASEAHHKYGLMTMFVGFPIANGAAIHAVSLTAMNQKEELSTFTGIYTASSALAVLFAFLTPTVSSWMDKIRTEADRGKSIAPYDMACVLSIGAILVCFLRYMCSKNNQPLAAEDTREYGTTPHSAEEEGSQMIGIHSI